VEDALKRIDDGTFGQCTVDGGLIDARRLDAVPWTPYCSTHERLKAVGRPAQLAYGAHLLMENRSGLIVSACVLPADGYGERDAALVMTDGLAGGRITLGMDKGYDVPAFIATLRQMDVTPHVAQHTTKRRSGIDGRTTRHPGYAVSQGKRKLVEQAFGWIKTGGGLRKLRHRGGRLVNWIFTFGAAAYNIVRLRRLLPASA
jgi:hypothetical protein